MSDNTAERSSDFLRLVQRLSLTELMLQSTVDCFFFQEFHVSVLKGWLRIDPPFL